MSNDPSSGDQPGWQGQQPYPGYGQQRGEQPGYAGSAYPPPGQQGYGQAAPPWAPQGGQPAGGGYPGGTPGGYPSPAGLGPNGAGPQGAPSGFVAAMTDFNFNSFATPAVIKVLYILNLVLIGLGLIVVVFAGIYFLTQSPGFGLLVLVGGVVASVIGLIYTRVILELIYAGIRTAEDVRALRNRS